MPVESVLPLVIGISVVSLGVAWLLAREVLAADTGKPEMRAIADAIREGAEAFLSRQYRTIGLLSVVAAAAIFALLLPEPPRPRTSRRWAPGTSWKVTISFLIGRGLLGDRRLHRHVRLDPRQHPHGGGGHDEPQQARCRSRCAAGPSRGCRSCR